MADINNMGRELGWDDVIENDSTFTLLPEGDYPFEVTGMERARHNGSAKLPACAKAVLTIKIDGGALGTTTVTNNLFLHTRTEGLLCAFFTAIGQRKHGEPLKMNWGKVIGARGHCKVGIRKWIGEKDGQEHESNEIKQFLEPQGSGNVTYTAGDF
jgi:hypothetical protein